MLTKLSNFFKSIGVGLWIAFAFIFAVIVGGLRLFYSGKESGRADADADVSKAEADRVKKAGERGEAETVLDSFRRATDKGRK